MERELMRKHQLSYVVPHADELIHRKCAPSLLDEEGSMVRRDDVMGPGATTDANPATTLEEEERAQAATQQQINEAMPALERRAPTRHTADLPFADMWYVRRDEREQDMTLRGRPILTWREQQQNRAATLKRGRSPPSAHPSREASQSSRRPSPVTQRGRSSDRAERPPPGPPAGPKPKAARRADSKHAKGPTFLGLMMSSTICQR